MLKTIPYLLKKTYRRNGVISKSLAVLVLVVLTTGSVFAQIATYTGFGGTSTATAGVPNETVTILQTVGFGANTPCGSGGISGLTNNGVFAYAPTNAHLFMQIRPNAGYALNITGFTAGLRRSNSGLQKVRFAYSLDNGVTWIDDLTDHVPNNGGCGTTAVSSWGVGVLPTGITSTTNGIIVALYPYDPIASGGVIQVNTIVINGTVVAANTAPTFVGGATQSLVVCENTSATFINPLMAITDPDVGQTETWTVVSSPSFGTLGGFSTTATSTGAAITPTGLTYTPNPGFSGTDAFKIQISDGIASSVTQVNVTVNASPSPILGTPEVCVGSNTMLSNATTGGTWSSSSPLIATIGTSSGILSGIATGTSTISYTASTGCSTSAVATVDPLPSSITGITSVCIGSTTSLSDVSASGNWSSSNVAIATIGSATGVVTGVAAGTALITYTLATGCMTTTIVTVNSLPAIINGPSHICTGNSVTLTDATLGGTWSSSGLAASIGSATGILNGLGLGITTVTYTLPTGCMATMAVTVDLTPSAIMGASNVCEGITITLSDAAIGGVWSSSDITIASVGSSTGIVTGIAAGTPNISYTSSTGCSTSVSITVNASPSSITGALSVCTGLTTALSNTVSGGTWTSGATTIATVNALTGLVTGISLGTATISYTLTGSCTASAVVTVNASLSPISGTPNLCESTTTNLSNTVSGGIWSTSNPTVATIGSSTGVVSGLSAGTAIISYGGASCASVGVIVTVNSLPATISGVTSVCVGFFTTLSDAIPTGIWNSSNTSVATVNPSGMVSGIASGTTVISYILATGCLVTTTVTVNAMPTAITGTSVICAGTSTTLSDGIAGGMWVSSNPSAASVGSTSGVVTGVAGGATTISYALAGGCQRVFAMTVNAAPAAVSGPSNICTGNPVLFSDAVSGGTWSSSASSTASVNPLTGLVNPINPGSVFISYSIAGCSPATRLINVGLSPAPLSGVTHVCAGLSTNLSDATPGGLWSSSNPVVTVSATGMITGLSVGAGATITYALSPYCFVTANVFADLLPAPIKGADTVCPGSSVMLSDSTVGGVWSSSDGTRAEAIALTGKINGLTAGSVTITYTLVTGCYTVVPFYVLTPLPAFLDISGAPTGSVLCHNTPVTLTPHATNGGVPTYEWKLFGAHFSFDSVLTYNPTHGDFLTCVMTTHSVCASPAVVAKDVVLNVWPLGGPIVNITCNQADTISYIGEEYTFYSVVTFGGTSPTYQWYVNGLAVPGATYPVFTTRIYDDNEYVYCQVTGNSPCDTSSFTGTSNGMLIHGLGYLSVGTISGSNDLSLFPNPNKGSFTLGGTTTANDVTFKVCDMLGRTIYTGTATPQNGQLHAEIKLDNNIPQGAYILSVNTESGSKSFHFVVE